MSFVVNARKNVLPHRSLLAMCVCAALPVSSAFAAPQSEDTVLVEASADNAQAEESQDYSVKTTTTGTKLLLVPRDIPQSVSVISQQRMQDQELNTIGEVLDNTTGVSASRIDSHRTNFFARGFFISNFAYEDMPTFLDNRWNFGDTAGDTAIFEKIEVVRGAAGLMSGTGNPSAYVNMVRKHADSKKFKGSVSATYGSWDKQRYVMDLQAPLTESGDVRGRVIAGYQDNDSWSVTTTVRSSFTGWLMPILPTLPPSLWVMTIRKMKKIARPGVDSRHYSATVAAPISAVVSIPLPTGPIPMVILPKSLQT